MTLAPPVRVCVVDDEAPAREGLAELLGKDSALEVVGICATGAEAVESILETKPDIVFLDVQMPEMNGFEVIRAVGVEKMPIVVFTTAYDSYALDAFEVHAVEYLLKPYTDDRLKEAVSRATQVFRERRLAAIGENLSALLHSTDRTAVAQTSRVSRIAIRNDGVSSFIPTSEIDWIEAADYYSRIHSGGKKHLLRESLSSLESRLDPATFFRAHRSALLNIDRVREIQPMFNHESVAILKDGTKIKLSRGRRAPLESLLEGRA